MAVTHGKSAAVYRGTNTLAQNYPKIVQTTNWTLNAPAEFGEIRRHGDNWVTRLHGITDWSGSFDALLDGESNQTLYQTRLLGSNAAFGGGTITVALFLTSATMPRYEGPAFVSDVNPSAPVGDMQAMTVSFVGNGTLLFHT